MKKFNLKLSRQIDAIHVALDQIRVQPNTPLKLRKLLLLRTKLRRLEGRI